MTMMTGRVMRWAMLATLVVMTLACGWFDEDQLDIKFDKDFDFEAPINANMLCPAGVDCAGTAVPAPVEQKLKPIEVDVDIDIVNQTGGDEKNVDLRKYTGKFKSIEIVEMKYATDANTLSFDLPEMKIYMGTVANSKPTDEGAKLLGTVPVIAKGWTGTGDVAISAENKAAISELIKGLQFSFIAYAEPVIKQGEQMPPTGETKIKFTMKVRLVANPADAIKN